MSSVLPQHDGPKTAMKNFSVVELILFIDPDLEARSQLCMKAKKTKMLTFHNQDEKNTSLIKDTPIRNSIIMI